MKLEEVRIAERLLDGRERLMEESKRMSKECLFVGYSEDREYDRYPHKADFDEQSLNELGDFLAAQYARRIAATEVKLLSLGVDLTEEEVKDEKKGRKK